MISVGNNKAVICKGDFHPAALYKGDKKIAGYTVEEFSAEGNVTLENCYNDKLHNTQIFGNSIQDGTPTPEAPIEIQSVGELVTEGEYAGKYKIPVTARGKNSLNISAIQENHSLTVNGVNISVDSDNQKVKVSGTAVSSGGRLNYITKITLPAGRYYFSTNSDEYMFALTNIKSTSSVVAWNNRSFTLTETTTLGLGFNMSKDRVYDFETWVQIDKGQQTPYEPYIEPQTFNIYLDEPLGKAYYATYAEYADYVDFSPETVNIKTKKRVITDTESSWVFSYDKQEGYSCFYFFINGDSTRNITDMVKSNYLPFVPFGYTLTNAGECISVQSNGRNVMVILKSEVASTLDEFKAWLKSLSDNGQPFTIWYNLRPDFQISKKIILPELPTFKGTTIYEIATEIPATISGKYKKVEV